MEGTTLKCQICDDNYVVTPNGQSCFSIPNCINYVVAVTGAITCSDCAETYTLTGTLCVPSIG